MALRTCLRELLLGHITLIWYCCINVNVLLFLKSPPYALANNALLGDHLVVTVLMCNYSVSKKKGKKAEGEVTCVCV